MFLNNEPMKQYAPFPEALDRLVDALRYRPGWAFALLDIKRDSGDSHSGEAGGLTFIVHADVYDTYHPERKRPVTHYFPVPAATYDARAWGRWLLDCLISLETHEACEWFHFVVQGAEERPFAPVHKPGANPYTITELATDEERRTSFQGILKAS